MKLLNQNQIAKVALFALGMAFALQAQAIVSKSRGVPAGWTENFEEAKEKAAKDGKFILLVSCQSDGYWGADRVRGLWGNARFAGKAKKKYVLMMIDTAKNVSNLSKRAIEENPKIMREYGIWGYNDMLILDSDGELIRRPRCDSYDISPEDLWTKLEGETKDLIWPKPKKVDKKAKKAQAKSTSGSKTRKLAEDAAAQDNNSQYMIVSKSNELFTISGPYGIRMTADAGCEKGAEYVMKKLVNVYLPRAREYYGDPFQGKKPTRVYTIDVRMNDGLGNSEYTGPSYRPGTGSWSIGLSKGAERYEMSLDYLASSVLTVCRDAKWASFVFYVNRILEGVAKHIDPTPRLKDDIRKGLKQDKDDKNSWYCAHAPTWAVLEELRTKHPTFILDYCNLKNSRYSEGKLPEELSLEQMAELLSEVTDENVAELFSKYGVEENESRNPVRRSLSTSSRRTLGNSTSGKVSVAEKLQECDFLLNKDFKKNAKFYLCLFSASWCGPCRREMPRIAKTYVETLKDDPDIELIHFSRDQSDEKALAWAKEHDVKFPVVKPKGGNPLDLHSRGIPHLFIVKADGTLVEEGHPMRIFNEEKFRELKGNSAADARLQGDNGNAASCKGKEPCSDRAASKVLASNRPFVTKEEIRRLLTSAQPRQKIVAPHRDSQAELPVFTNPAEAQRKAKELGLWMFVYNMPCSRSDTFSGSSYFLKSLSKHCVFVHVKGFGSESAECPWERSTCWPCCRILDADGNLISSVAKWSGMPNCEVSGQKMAEIFKGFMTAFEVMPSAFDAVERDPNEAGLAKLHDALSSLPESFVNIVYLKWAELLVRVDQTGSKGWRSCYSYADKVRPLQDEFRRADDCRFNNDYWRAKRDKKKYHDFLTGIDRVAFERRISTVDDIQRRIASIDEQGLSDEAQYRLEYLRKEVKESKERLAGIQKDLSATGK